MAPTSKRNGDERMIATPELERACNSLTGTGRDQLDCDVRRVCSLDEPPNLVPVDIPCFAIWERDNRHIEDRKNFSIRAQVYECACLSGIDADDTKAGIVPSYVYNTA